jgi:hypothetical protein
MLGVLRSLEVGGSGVFRRRRKLKKVYLVNIQYLQRIIHEFKINHWLSNSLALAYVNARLCGGTAKKS